MKEEHLENENDDILKNMNYMLYLVNLEYLIKIYRKLKLNIWKMLKIYSLE